MPNSSINTGLANTPDLTGVDNKYIDFHLIQIYNAIGILQQGIDTYTGNTPSGDPTSFNITDPGASITTAKQSIAYYKASGAIDAGKLVTINSDKTVSHADNTVATKIARGIALASAADATNVQICLLGSLNIYAAASFTPGSTYYLGAAGLFSISIPAVGLYSQPIGYALSDTEIYFNPALESIVVPAPPVGP